MNTRRIQPMTRVEGMGQIELHLDDQERVAMINTRFTEAPRFFERIALGRQGLEIPSLISRICAICSAPHRVTACRAVEKATDTLIPRKAELLRDLLLTGSQIESHALHLFALILPDITGHASLLAFMEQHPEPAEQGLALKQFGNRIQEVVGGRAIHPVTIEPGGITAAPMRSTLRELGKEAGVWRTKLPELLVPFLDPQSYPKGRMVEGVSAHLDLPDTGRLIGESLIIGGQRFPIESYADHLVESESPDTAANAVTFGGRTVVTGPIVRDGGIDPAGTVHNGNRNRAQELCEAVEQVIRQIEELAGMPEDDTLMAPLQKQAGRGVAAMEAPRGILIHDISLNEDGMVTAANVITPTTINAAAISRQLQVELASEPGNDATVHRAERIIRAYDPCISCAVHLIRF